MSECEHTKFRCSTIDEIFILFLNLNPFCGTQYVRRIKVERFNSTLRIRFYATFQSRRMPMKIILYWAAIIYFNSSTALNQIMHVVRSQGTRGV